MLRENPGFTCDVIAREAWQTTYLVNRNPVGFDPVLVLGLVIAQVTRELGLKVHCIDVVFQVTAVSGLVTTLGTLIALIHDVVHLSKTKN